MPRPIAGVRWLPALLAAAALAFPACAQQAEPDLAAARAGLDYARMRCATCHSVELGQKTPEGSKAPAFAAVARVPAMTSMALNVWLHTAHPTMPALIVEPADRDDLLAYFAALKAAQRQGRPVFPPEDKP